MPEPERIINRNPWLYGPGPVRRIPKGVMGYYGRMPAHRSFGLAAIHGVIFSLAGATAYKVLFGDPQIKLIEDYYKENPPR
jgi:hypothetical protein